MTDELVSTNNGSHEATPIPAPELRDGEFMCGLHGSLGAPDGISGAIPECASLLIGTMMRMDVANPNPPRLDWTRAVLAVRTEGDEAFLEVLVPGRDMSGAPPE